jgi:NADH-quinone oxidoreductase subunit I
MTASYFQQILRGSWSLLVGMWITLRHTFRRAVTVNYPYESIRMPARYRGHIELIRDEQSGQPKCVVCMACQKACPSGCIALDGVKPEGGTRRVPTQYVLNFTTCSLCGLCVESCKFDALRFSKDYNLASVRRADYVMDLLARLQQEKT